MRVVCRLLVFSLITTVAATQTVSDRFAIGAVDAAPGHIATGRLEVPPGTNSGTFSYIVEFPFVPASPEQTMYTGPTAVQMGKASFDVEVGRRLGVIGPKNITRLSMAS